MADKRPDKTELDIISMVQKARMIHDEDAVPSKAGGVYWIEAKCETCTGPTPRSGQWVREVDVESVDAIWQKVKAATEAGKLGYKSKVATASRNQKSPDSRLIAVRTADADDQADVERVREALREFDLDGDWRYERDQEAAPDS
jgi:hypothetical protein